MNGKSIKEQVWQTAEEPKMTRHIFPEIQDPLSFKYGYAAYTDLEVGVLEGYLSDTPIAIGPCVLSEHISKSDPRGLWDLVFALDTYFLTLLVGEPRCTDNTGFVSVPTVDELLHPSRGLLIWKHQLEDLYRLFDTSNQRCVEFRRGINNKLPATLRKAQSLTFACGTSLGDVIEERSVFGVQTRPSLRAAHLLSAS
ncbi:MAG: hypothetical protein RIE53_09755 [Rhodothermales bacterium]